ncbi:MAG: PadR family transcriptional regulator [Vicinamibacterales bacterium]|jgi:transcriptional regulator
MGPRRKDNLQGTLDLLVLRTLAAGGLMHGYAISECIVQTSGDVLRVEEGSLYPALHRMEESGWIKSAWKRSDNNRRARFYRITASGRRTLVEVTRDWTKHVNAVMRVLRPT